MKNRDRIIHTVLGKNIDRLPFFFYFGPWGETIERWRKEGLSQDKEGFEEFGFDSGIEVVGVHLGYSPDFGYTQIEDKGDTLIVRDQYGILKEIRKNGSSIPRFIEYPVKTAADWEELKKRLDPESPQRFPDNWNILKEKYNREDKAIQLGSWPYGLFGTLRDMMGVEELLVSFYEQPELIRDMMDYLTDFWIAIYEKVCRDVKVDCIHMWEDMSGRNGSLISPGMVREFMMPNYKKIKRFAEKNDIPVFSLDTDGDCSELVPLYMECGINLVMPFEVAAGCDITGYRRKYQELCIMGGIDKREIAKGKEAIDRELGRISEMFDHGRYIAALDHLVHPEISWADFNYFVNRLKEMIGVH
ncbi:MAG: hypothetical protein FIA99_16615 [Ruminiclostridium sp.]|nr:hypothetical protein [Ruminiclostridium sp.]